jgi:hypothetical protein
LARNVTLEKLLTDFRAEARLSLDPAHNVQTRDSHINLIQREQERLWEDFAWPHLRVQRFIPVQAGQRYYDADAAVTEAGAVPTSQIPIERIETIEIKSDARWLPMGTGIGAQHYAAHDSALDERAWPPRFWKISEGENLEIWPVPDTTATAIDQYGYLRITGIRALRPLAQDGDRADLDHRLLTLYAAGAALAAAGAKDAQIKLEAAQRHYGRLKGGLSKVSDFNMFGTTKRPADRRPYVTRYKPPVA